jgi:hypothetical protein
MKDEIELGDEYYEFTEADEALLNDPDLAYDEYRDAWSESLLSDIKKLHAEYVLNKKGYYFDASERFVEHAILCLAETARVQLLPELNGRVGAKLYQAPRVEFVEEFNELKPEEVSKDGEVQVNIKP